MRKILAGVIVAVVLGLILYFIALSQRSSPPTAPTGRAIPQSQEISPEKIGCVAGSGMWLVSHHRQEGEAAIADGGSNEVGLCVDATNAAYIQPEENGPMMRLTGESFAAAFPDFHLVLEGVNKAEWDQIVTSKPRDRHVIVVKAICAAGVEVDVFTDKGMIVAGEEAFSLACPNSEGKAVATATATDRSVSSWANEQGEKGHHNMSQQARNVLLEAGKTQEPWKALDAQEVRDAVVRTFGNHFDFQLAQNAVWTESIRDNIAMMTFCKPHSCSDQETAFTIDLNTGFCAGTNLSGRELKIFIGDYSNNESLPEMLKTYIKQNTE